MDALDFTGMTVEQKFEAAGKYAGVPANLFEGLWSVESSRGANLRSPKGARGHFQIMPDTQETLEKRTARSYDPDNFDDSLNMAAQVMRENIGKFKTIDDALRAYNAGWDRSRWDNEETRAYVGKVASEGNMEMAGAMTMQANRIRTSGDGWAGTPVDDSLLDAAWRGDALGDVSALAESLRKRHLTDMEKGVVNEAGVRSAAAEMGAPEAVQVVVNTVAAAKEQATELVASRAALETAQSLVSHTSTGASDAVKRSYEAALEREKYVQSLTALDKWGASFGTSLLAGAIRSWDNEVADYYPPGWKYSLVAKAAEDGLDWRERQQMRTASSDADITRIRGEIEQQRQDKQVLGAMSNSSQILWGLAAGFSDPLGWAAGFGVGKAAQMMKVGAATYFAAGRPVAGFVSSAAEGGVGNLLAGATLDAMGDYRTSGDYVMDAGMGLAFGGALAGIHVGSDAIMSGLRKQMNAEASVQNVELAWKAQELAGPNATPDQVRIAADAIVDAEEGAWRLATLGNVDNSDRLFSRSDIGRDGEAVSAFSSDAERADLIARYELDKSIPDQDTQALVAEVIRRAENITGRIEIDPARLKTWLAKFDQEAASTKLLKSESVVSRAVASMLMENPEGAAGRRSTAAIARSASFEMYMGNISRNTEDLFGMWAKQRGIGSIGRTFDDKARVQFNKEVQLEMNRRWNNQPDMLGTDPLVRKAADMYDFGYRMMAKDQQYVGVLGADAIDTTTSGYFQRSWNLGALRNLQGGKRSAFLNALEDQFRTVAKFTDSDNFSVRHLAIEYLARLEHRAVGMLDVPANLYSREAGTIIKDALGKMGLTADEVERQMGKFTRGAAGYTKNRIDMDYSKKYDDGAGGQFQLVDFLDNDMNGLYRKYAANAAGEVALAKYGVMGRNGAQLLKEAMLRTGATQKELDAFDQFMAEMLGKQFGNGDPVILQNVRAMTNLSRMGGAVFPQMGQYIDAVVGLGLERGLKVAGLTNKMRKEVQALARGEKVDNPILGGFEGIGPEFGLAEYRVFGIFDTMELTEIAGKEVIGRATKAIRAGANMQRIMSGHRWVVAAQTRGVADQIVRKAMRYVKEGGESKALADMGIDNALVDVLSKRMSKIAKFDKNGELMSFDPRKLDVDDVDGRRAVVAFRDAVMRGTNQIMNKEFPGEVGKWAHSGWLKTLFQFRTFSMVAQQKQFNRILHTHGAGKLTALLLGGMMVAAPIHMTRVGLRASLMDEEKRKEYIEKNTHPVMLGRATLNYLAAVGLWADVAEAASGAGTGWADAIGFEMPDELRPTGGRSMKDTDIIGGQLAPGLGVVNELGQGVFGKPKMLLGNAPFASLPYVQPILMGIESEFED